VKATIKPGSIKGEQAVAASKSAMQRACAAAFIRNGQTRLVNAGFSEDDKAALSIIKQMGATVSIGDNFVDITGGNFAKDIGKIDCGESGLSSRLFTSLVALSDKPVTVTGSGSLKTRPFSFFDEILPKLEVSCHSDNGHLPLEITGPLKPADLVIDGSLSSQFLTGLLFAFTAAKAHNVTITVNDLASKPYIDLTLKVMQDFNLPVPENNNYQQFYFPAQFITGNTSDELLEYTIEGDWSGAAFLLVAGAINGKQLDVKGLDLLSVQADRKIIEALVAAGADMDFRSDDIRMKKSKLKGFEFDARDCPDLFPPLVSLACYCEGETIINGVHRLEHKESHRALTLQEEFGKLGVKIVVNDDNLIVKPPKVIRGAFTDSHNDHRIAMALAVTALNAENEVVINHAEAVKKSYPYFWQHLQNVGALVSLNEIGK
jgi:3-phosphoshikimate 1-carboxyvinyltransferase